MRQVLLSNKVESWLKENMLKRILWRLAGGAGVLLIASVILFLTFWAVYIAVYIGFNWIFPHTHAMRIWVSYAVLFILFVGHFTVSREYLSSYSFSTGTVSDDIVNIYAGGSLGRWCGSNINPLAPDSMHSGVKAITDAILTGPRIFMGGIANLVKAYRLSRIDIEGCTKVISILVERGEKVPFTRILEQLPDLDMLAVSKDLECLNEIVFLAAEPPGIILKDSARLELG